MRKVDKEGYYKRLLRYDERFQKVFNRSDVVSVRYFERNVFEKTAYEFVDLSQSSDPFYIYFSFRRVLAQHIDRPLEALSKCLWVEVRECFSQTMWFNRVGVARFGAEFMPLQVLFLRLFRCSYPDFDHTDQHIMNVWRALLLSRMRGVVGEHKAFHALRGLFGGCVSYGSVRDDKADIDVWVGNVPVSVKCLRAFSPKTVARLRGAGKVRPALYVNECGDWLLPVGVRVAETGSVNDLVWVVSDLQASL